MNTIQRVTKNVSVLFISQMSSYVLGFFTLAYTARYLGVTGFGTISFALALTGIFAVTMDLGLSTLAVREVARDKSITKDYVANITALKILLSILTFGIIYFILQLFGYNPQTVQVVYFIAIYMIFTTFPLIFYAIFQANEKMEYQSLGAILSSALLLGGILIAIHLNFNIIQFSFIYTLVGAIVFVYVILTFSIKFSRPKIKFNTKQWKDLILEAWPFAITGISINLYLWTDTIILSLIKGPEAVGLYNASYRLILVLLFVPFVFNNAVYPLMSQYYISSKKSLKFTFEKLFKIMILIAVPIGVGTVLIANKIILLVYGDQFLGAVIALQILIWSCVLIFARSPFERLLESTNRQLLITKIFIIGVIFNIILNLIFIPKYSYIGAGIITVLTDALVLCLLIFITRNFNILVSNEIRINILKIIIASLIMGVILKYLLNFNVFVLITIGTIIYCVLLLLLRIVNDEEISMIKTIFRRGN
jgi:O-antigen/teichoic acid export membrane protein